MSLYHRIEAAAANVSVRVVLQTLVLAPFYLLTFILGFIVRLIWGVLLRVWLGLRVGLSDGWKGKWDL